MTLNLRKEPGWMGDFTREQYPGALPNGTEVVKVLSDASDAHKDGDYGVVLGSIGHPMVGIGYFIEWQDTPRLAAFIEARKVRAREWDDDRYSDRRGPA